MSGVLVGFAIIAVIVLVGWVLGRHHVLGLGAEQVLTRLGFFVLSPALLFSLLAESDLHALMTKQLPIAAASAAAVILGFLAVALTAWRRPLPEAVIGGLAAGYSNYGNIGIPLGTYVLGNAAATAPAIMFQVVVLAPIALTILDVTTSGHTSLRRILLQPATNPLVLGSLAGLAVAATGWRPPEPVMAPFELVGAAAAPVMLLNFGVSLAGSKVLASAEHRADVIVASLLKLVAMPAIAWAIGAFVLHLEGQDLFAATALSALPTAQNVLNYAQRYGRAVAMARDTVFVTTIASIAVLTAIALLLA